MLNTTIIIASEIETVMDHDGDFAGEKLERLFFFAQSARYVLLHAQPTHGKLVQYPVARGGEKRKKEMGPFERRNDAMAECMVACRTTSSLTAQRGKSP